MLLLSGLERARSQYSAAQQKVVTQKELNKPSDDPYSVVRVLEIDETSRRTDQYRRTITDSLGFLDTSYSAVQNMLDMVQRAEQLGMEAAGAVGPSERNMLADEIDQIAEQLKSQANATYGANYVFGGTVTANPPYAQGVGLDSYNGNLSTITRDISKSTSLTVNIVGPAVIGDGTAGLLKNLRDLAADMRAGNVNNIVSGGIPALKTDRDALLEAAATISARTNRLQIADARLQDLSLSLSDVRSKRVDADMSKALVELNSRSAALEAALSASGRIMQTTLMDYLR